MTASGRNWGMEIFQVVVGLAIVALLGYILIAVFQQFLDFLTQVHPTIGTAVVGTLGTVLLGVGAALLTQYQIKKRALEDAHREEKIRIYTKLVDLFARNLAANNDALKGKPIPKHKLITELFEFKTGLILRGSSGVIRAMAEFEGVSVTDGDVLEVTDKIYREIRKDIGLSNRGLRKYELIGVYLKSEEREKMVR